MGQLCLAAGQGSQEGRPYVTNLGFGRRALPCYYNILLWVMMGPSPQSSLPTSPERTLFCCCWTDSSAPSAGITTALRSSPTMTYSLSMAPRWLRGTRPASVWRTQIALQVCGFLSAYPLPVIVIPLPGVRFPSALLNSPWHLGTLAWQLSARKTFQNDRFPTF